MQPQNKSQRKSYPSDLTPKQFALLEPIINRRSKRTGRQEKLKDNQLVELKEYLRTSESKKEAHRLQAVLMVNRDMAVEIIKEMTGFSRSQIFDLRKMIKKPEAFTDFLISKPGKSTLSKPIGKICLSRSKF